MAKKTVAKIKKKSKNIPNGVAHIHSTFNNTIVAITDTEGKVISWRSGGTSGFKGTKKGTPFAAQIAAEQAAGVAMENGIFLLFFFTLATVFLANLSYLPFSKIRLLSDRFFRSFYSSCICFRTLTSYW